MKRLVDIINDLGNEIAALSVLIAVLSGTAIFVMAVTNFQAGLIIALIGACCVFLLCYIAWLIVHH